MAKVWTAEEVEKILVIAQDVVSLNQKISTSEDDEIELGAFIEDPAPGPEELAIKNDKREMLIMYLDKYLTPREKIVLEYRYGLVTGDPMTLEGVGKVINLTRERVRQLEARALRKLRIKLAGKGLTEEDA